MNRLVKGEKPHILDSCTGCGYCFLLCPQGAVQSCKGAVYRINKDLCNGCDKCVYACPVNAVAGKQIPFPKLKQDKEFTRSWHKEEEYDVVVIGAGIGGLLSAAALSTKGIRTALVERLNFAGGRFTHFDYEGAAINTGACHALPFGEKGPFAELVESLEVPVKIISAGGMGSLYVSGRQYRWREIMDFMVPFSMQDRFELLKIIPKILGSGKPDSPDLSFGRWLGTQTSSEMIRAFFDRMFTFGCSIGIEEIDYIEALKIINNIYRVKAPALIEGGCGYLVEKLLEMLRLSGGTILMETEAVEVLAQREQVIGVNVKNRRSGNEKILASKLVISDIGPGNTFNLLPDLWRADPVVEKRHLGAEEIKSEAIPAAAGEPCIKKDHYWESGTSGLCINMICDAPMLSHAPIMYCLDTKRVAGITQPSGLDPGLAPQGKYLLTAYQRLESEDPDREVALGLNDLRTVFGEKFNNYCRVINTGVFKNAWPVNRSAQGRDYPATLQIEGLYLVGDGCKAPGFVMVEGIAARVKEMLMQIDATLIKGFSFRESLKE